MRCAALALLLTTLLATSGALADPGRTPPTAAELAQARRIAREGMSLLDQDRVSEAYEHFRFASTLVDAPTLGVLEARALERLGRLREAKAVLERVATAELRSDAPRAYVLAQRAARTRMAEVSRRIPRILVRASGERVHVDDEIVPLADGTALIEVDPGAHSVHRPGEPARAVSLRQFETVEVELDSRVSPLRSVGWVSIGVAAAGLTSGVVLGVLALDEKNDLERACAENRCPPARHDDLARFRTERTLSTASYAVGGVALGLGVALLTIAPAEDDRSPRLTVSLSPRSRTPLTARVSGAF